MNVFLWWPVVGIVVLVLLIATGWFNDAVEPWLIARIAITVLLWPAALAMWGMDQWH